MPQIGVGGRRAADHREAVHRKPETRLSMARKTTPTFIVELPLSVARADAREMGVRLELGRQLYNACLGEGLRRLERLREQRTWAQACAMPRMKDGKPNKER